MPNRQWVLSCVTRWPRLRGERWELVGHAHHGRGFVSPKGIRRYVLGVIVVVPEVDVRSCMSVTVYMYMLPHDKESGAERRSASPARWKQDTMMRDPSRLFPHHHSHPPTTMADDTRQPPEDLSKAALNVHPENKAFMGQVWQGGKQIAYKPPESANIMPGGTQHTAGGQVPEVTLLNALTTGVPITEIHTRPCVRDSLLQGMVGGFALGGTRLIFGCTYTSMPQRKLTHSKSDNVG